MQQKIESLVEASTTAELKDVQDKYEQKLALLQAELDEASAAALSAMREKEKMEAKMAALQRDHAAEIGTLESQLRSNQDLFEQLSVRRRRRRRREARTERDVALRLFFPPNSKQADSEQMRERLGEMKHIEDHNRHLQDQVDELKARLAQGLSAQTAFFCPT